MSDHKKTHRVVRWWWQEKRLVGILVLSSVSRLEARLSSDRYSNSQKVFSSRSPITLPSRYLQTNNHKSGQVYTWTATGSECEGDRQTQICVSSSMWPDIISKLTIGSQIIALRVRKGEKAEVQTLVHKKLLLFQNSHYNNVVHVDCMYRLPTDNRGFLLSVQVGCIWITERITST